MIELLQKQLSEAFTSLHLDSIQQNSCAIERRNSRVNKVFSMNLSYLEAKNAALYREFPSNSHEPGN